MVLIFRSLKPRKIVSENCKTVYLKINLFIILLISTHFKEMNKKENVSRTELKLESKKQLKLITVSLINIHNQIVDMRTNVNVEILHFQEENEQKYVEQLKRCSN